jgi:hypothetical protein
MGAFVEARTRVAEGLAAYDDTDDFAHRAISGYTPQIFGLGIGGWNEWFLGYPNRSRDAALEAVTVARRIGHPQSIDQALNSAAHACLLARDPESAQGSWLLRASKGFICATLWHVSCTDGRCRCRAKVAAHLPSSRRR